MKNYLLSESCIKKNVCTPPLLRALFKTLSALLTNTDTFANSVDPDETTHMSRIIRIYTVCHSISEFSLICRFATMHMPKCKDRRVHLRNIGVLGLRIAIFEKGFLSPRRIFLQLVWSQFSLEGSPCTMHGFTLRYTRLGTAFPTRLHVRRLRVVL